MPIATENRAEIKTAPAIRSLMTFDFPLCSGYIISRRISIPELTASVTSTPAAASRTKLKPKHRHVP